MSFISNKDDDGVIDLRGDAKDVDAPEFIIEREENPKEEDVVEQKKSISSSPQGFGGVKSVPLSELEDAALKPYDKVKVKFDKFVTLVATHDYEEIFDRHMDDDVIISTDLLADLAVAHEEKVDKKVPFIFIIGILLGVGIAWILLKT
jgi:hypothetical protein